MYDFIKTGKKRTTCGTLLALSSLFLSTMGATVGWAEDGSLVKEPSGCHDATGESCKGAALDIAREFQISGMVDTIYGYNFNEPPDGKSPGRVYDRNSEEFNLNAGELVFQKPITERHPWGARIDLYGGTDSEPNWSAGLGDPEDYINLQQAYFEIDASLASIIPDANKLNLKFGKFVSLIGAEVIESRDNWNTTRAFAFGYAVPFTLTGARATYTFDNGWDAALALVNGWDTFQDTNQSKSVEGHFGFNNIKLGEVSSLTFLVQGIYGSEMADDNDSKRALGDFVAIWKTPWEPLSFMYNFDYGHEENGDPDGGPAHWVAQAVYGRVNILEQVSLSTRLEYFDDAEGVRISSGYPANYKEYTVTLEYRPIEKMVTRLEFRRDFSSAPVYTTDDGDTQTTQSTLNAELIYSFDVPQFL